MGNKHRQEFDGGHQLVVDAKARVKFCTLVVDQAVRAVSQPSEAHGWSFHVRQKPLQPGAVVSVYAAAEVCLKTRMFPGFEALHRFRTHLLLLEHHLEEPLAEDFLQCGEVEIIHGEEEAVPSKQPEGDQSMTMGVWYQKFSKGLWGDDHGRDSVVPPSHERRVLAHVVAGGGIHDATEIPVQRAVEEEGLSERYGYCDNELPV